MTPMITSVRIAEVCGNFKTQGDTISQSPTIKFSHSSQTANAVSAASDSTMIILPASTAFCEEPGRCEQDYTED